MKYCKIIVVRLVALHIESPICTDNTVSHSPWHSLSFKMYMAHINYILYDIIWDCLEISYETFPVKMKVLEIVKNEIHVSFVL